MKHKFYYFLGVVFICVLVAWGIRKFTNVEYIAQGYALENIASEWTSTISYSVNNKNFTVYVDGVAINAKENGIYMDTTMTLMIPYKKYVDLFHCAVNFYDDTKLVIEKSTVEMVMSVGSDELAVNDVTFKMNTAVTLKEDVLYVPVDAAIRGLGYHSTWDVNQNIATIINDNPESSILPYRYSYVEKNKKPTVKKQGKFGTCWAMAALTALESTLLPEEELVFAVDHMSLANSFNLTQWDGGSTTMSNAYLLAWQGPVLEAHDEYGDGETNVDLQAVKHVQEIQMIEAKDLQKIKEMVYKYGGVQSSLYTTMVNSLDMSKYYNSQTYGYCYVGTEKPNHDVVIIGWDDTYSKDNFNADIEKDGAFICQNSWGTNFGDEGIFYVSYYDSNIGMHNQVITKVEDIDNYNGIYQTDLCGWVGRMGYDMEEAYFANVYTARGMELLSAVGFYATGVNTSYEVYVCERFEDETSLRGPLTKMAEGKLVNEGYYTINLKEMIKLDTEQRFAVIVKVITPNAKKPIAVEYNSGEFTATVDLTDGEGYVSPNGIDWMNTESNEDSPCNVCLKCYTSK